MTTRQEYAEAAITCTFAAEDSKNDECYDLEKDYKIAARVLRALADGAVLCDGTPAMWTPFKEPMYRILKGQP